MSVCECMRVYVRVCRYVGMRGWVCECVWVHLVYVGNRDNHINPKKCIIIGAPVKAKDVCCANYCTVV